ncbi:hypothetical protein K492DRAFT_207026 [Lichtheimia hyalospora FSU 10163]|nr:hypothetical protein K492DRAFT_207026 [Lichtheimia hyalospora FSU 10163]
MEKKKRARGLAAQKAAKKSKIDQEPDASNAQTVMLEQVVEEGDEIGEVVALYTSAMLKCETDDITAALPLFRGTINESDRILRNWDAQERPPPKFYFAYGSALYELGRLSQDEEFEPYLDAAEERLDDGLDRFNELQQDDKNEHMAYAHKIRVALAKIWIAKAASQVQESTSSVPDIAVKALETLDQVLAEKDNELDTNDLVEIGAIVQSHGELYGELDKQTKFRDWAEKVLLRVVKDEPENMRALTELGLGQLSLANFWLDAADTEEQEEEQGSTELSQEEKNAQDALLKSQEYLEQVLNLSTKTNKVMPRMHADLAEVLINLSNLVSDEEQQQKLYQQAAEHIQNAKSVAQSKELQYELPEGLQLFLDEWSSSQ